MSAEAVDCQKTAFAFIDGLEGITSSKGVIDAMARSLGNFGFEHFVATGLPNHDERFEQSVIIRKWPIGWFEHYAREDFVRVDPVIRRCWQTVQPFEWTEARFDPEREPGAREVMGRAHDFGLKRGFSLPIHGIDGYAACFSMSGSHLDLCKRTKPAIHLMAMYAFNRVHQIVQPRRSKVSNPLTGREREVLRWAATGKSAADIAEKLSITERTVTAHMGNAMSKLQAANKTQAVVNAIQHRYIQI
jgi:LuxR family quorum sensing-dependent transcriptional regulator